MKKDSFLLYKSFYEPIKTLSDKQLGRLFRAIFEYQLGLNKQVDADLQMAFAFFKNQMEIDEGKYQKVVERNKQNGLNGGRPRNKEIPNNIVGFENPNNPVGFQKPKKADNDNDNDNDLNKSECVAQTPTHTYSDSEKEQFLAFQKWIEANAPRVNQMSKPFTIAQYLALSKKTNPDVVKDLLLAMENKKDLLKKYQSAYLTLTKWEKMNFYKAADDSIRFEKNSSISKRLLDKIQNSK